MAVTPWGDLYPCHQFVGEEQFRLGDVWKGVTNPERRRSSPPATLRPARMRGLLGKALLLRRLRRQRVSCDGQRARVRLRLRLFRKRMECAIMLEAAKALDGEEA